MATPPPTVTILKPINEVVNYLMDTNTWSKWGINFKNVASTGPNEIEGTYIYISPGGPNNNIVTDWEITSSLSPQSQTIRFTATWSTLSSPLPTVTYTFASTGNGTSTVVTREANPDDGMSEGLLTRLKNALESAT